MSYTAIKTYHGSVAVHNAQKYSKNTEKTNMNNAADKTDDPAFIGNTNMYTGEIEGNVNTQLKNAFIYSSNPNKTNVGTDGDVDLLVSGWNCKPDVAEDDFNICQDKYYTNGHKEKCDLAKSTRIMRAKLDTDGKPIIDTNGDMVYDEKSPIYKDENGKTVYQEYMKQKEARTAYMWVMSFPGSKELGYELDPRLIHEIGMEFCREFLPEYECTISTHVNTHHYHNHIMMCAYSMDGTHKYQDNMDSLKKARDLVDEISHKYDIPIILSPKTDRGIDWFEWKSRKDGDSWKEQMRQDIKNTLSISKDFNEYKHLMEESGYTLRETDKHITYYMPCADKNSVEYRCRDTKLNISDDEFDYSKENIINTFSEKDKDISKTKTQNIPDPTKTGNMKHHANHIYISKYDINGRKRSTLELIVIEALKLLTLLKDNFSDSSVKSESPIYKPSRWKIQQMHDTLSIIQNLGIKDKEQLDQMTNKAGTILSQLKHQYEEQNAVYKEDKDVYNKINEATELLKALKAYNIDSSMLYLYHYDKNDIRANKATLIPTTASQKRELNIEISKSPIYRITCKYDELTYREAENVLDFLKGRTTIKPDVLTDISEQSQRRLSSKYESVLQSRITGLKNKYGELPITDNQKHTITEIFSGQDAQYADKLKPFENMQINIDKLSYYDAYRIINFVKNDNTFKSPLADQISQDKVKILTEQNGDKLNRDLQYITLTEIKEIESYYKSGKRTTVPDIIKKNSKPGTLKEIASVKELLSLKNETTTVPIDKMTGDELFKLNTYLLFKDSIPEAITRTPVEEQHLQDMFYNTKCSDYPIEQLEQIDRCRNLLNELGGIGIDTNNIYTAKTEYEEAINAKDDTEKALDIAKIEYKNLKRLSYNIQLAGNRKFTNGPLFEEDDIQKIDIEHSTDIKSNEQRQAEIEDEKNYEEQKKQQDLKSDKIWNVADSYFDNL